MTTERPDRGRELGKNKSVLDQAPMWYKRKNVV